MDRKDFARLLLTGFLILLVSFLLFSFVGTLESPSTENKATRQSQLPFAERDPIVPPADSVTVVTGQGFGDGNSLMAFAPDGRLLRYEERYDSYLDVDPSPVGDMTVLYVASEEISATECQATQPCQRDVVERLNLSTGERERLYTFIAPAKFSQKIHDVDRIGPDRLLVGGIVYDRVFVVNTSTKIVEWQWDVQQALNRSSGKGGAGYPKDWTHLNDVERLPDGRIMVSLRNQDRVIFLDPDSGLQSNWTLGGEDEYDILYEQHNPDFIPESRGGPAVVVADSHNNRIVEYQRVDGEWEQTWTWRDDRLAWPRDADRLPNGNTLVVDSNGNRVLEVNQSGEIVWQIEADTIYDAERLGTGDESAGGQSAQALGLQSRTVAETEESSALGAVKDGLRSVIPLKVRNAVAFVMPGWIWWSELAAIAGILGLSIVWVVLEAYWRDVTISLHWPITFE